MADKLPRKYLTNEGVRVKRTPILRQYGVRCRNPWEANNNRVWPGDVGRLTQRTAEGNGWTQRVLEAEFSGGRTVAVASGPICGQDKDPAESVEWSFETGFDPAEFILVKKVD